MALDKISASFASMGHDDSKPDPSDFVRYYPWACGQLQCSFNVYISVQNQQAYVPQDPAERKNKSKYKVKPSAVEMASNADVDAKSFVSFSQFDDATVRVAAVFSNEQLIQLKFENNSYCPNDVIRVLSLILQFQPNLYMISMNSGADKSTIYELSRIVNCFRSHITELSLDSCYVPEANYSILLENSTLKYLSLARCKINDHVVKMIALNLTHQQPASKSLCILNLSTNVITDEGAQSIAYMLRSNRCLSYLNLSGNMITDTGAIAILDVLMDFPLTMDEILTTRVRKVEHLKKKNDLCLKVLVEMKKTEIAKRSTIVKRKKIVIGQRKRDSKDSSYAELDLLFFSKAYALAVSLMGPFKDPFDKDNVIIRKDISYNLGNNTLAYLNLSFTTISMMTLKKISSVMEYQRYQMRRPRGLITVGVEGNSFPLECDELDLINARIEAGLGQRRGSMVMKKRTAALAKKP